MKHFWPSLLSPRARRVPAPHTWDRRHGLGLDHNVNPDARWFLRPVRHRRISPEPPSTATQLRYWFQTSLTYAVSVKLPSFISTPVQLPRTHMLTVWLPVLSPSKTACWLAAKVSSV